MPTIENIVNKIELHDSILNSLKVNGDGSLELDIDFDEVWNKDLGKNIKGIIFNSVFEISEFKIDRLNVIGSVEFETINGYNKEFVTNCEEESEAVVMVSMEFVAGGNLTIVCANSAEYLK